jgi:hypothetical protein
MFVDCYIAISSITCRKRGVAQNLQVQDMCERGQCAPYAGDKSVYGVD